MSSGDETNAREKKEAREIKSIDDTQATAVNSNKDECSSCPVENASSSGTPPVTFGMKRKRSDGSREPSPSIPSWVAGASPPRYIGLEELVGAAKDFDRMALAHEIAIDPTFKLSNEPRTNESALEKSFREAMHKAFWLKLQEDLDKTPADYSHALKLLAEIKETLLGLTLPHQPKMRAHIEEHLDMELLTQHVDKHCLNLDTLAAFVLETMGKMCSPARDEKLAELKQTGNDLVPLFRGIFGLLDDMKLDMANFTISQLRPIVQQNAVDYKRTKFEELLKTNPDGLKRTTEWLSTTLSEWYNQQPLKSPERKQKAAAAIIPSTSNISQDEIASGQKPTKSNENDRLDAEELNRILSGAFVALLRWNYPEDAQNLPETCAVDAERYTMLSGRYYRLLLTASVLAITVNTGGRQFGAKTDDLKANLKQHLGAILDDGGGKRSLFGKLPNMGAQAVKEINDVLGDVPLSESQIKALKDQVLALESDTDPVRTLIAERIDSFLTAVLMRPSQGDTGGPLKVPPGLSQQQSELASTAGTLLTTVAHNRLVFSDRYLAILHQHYANINDTKDTSSSS